MCAFYILENNSFISIISRFIEKNVFTQYPINTDDILHVRHYYHIPLYIIQTRNAYYYYIDSNDTMNDIVNSIKRNIINEDILQKEYIVKLVSIELSNYKFHHPNSLNDDDCLLIEKRLYHAHENLRNSKIMQLSSIFIETEVPIAINNFFTV
jgi:hypothetical protein